MQTTDVTEFYYNFGDHARRIFGYKRKMPKFIVSSCENQNALAETMFFTDTPEYVVLNHLAFPFMDEDEVTRVVKHEIAHVMAGVYAQHGPEWEATMVTLGVEP